MNPKANVCAVLILAFVAGFGQAWGGDMLDPTASYQGAKSNPVTYQIDFRVIVTAPYKAKVLRVWLPIPPSDTAQEVSGSEFSTFPTKMQPEIATEPVFGNTFAYFEFKAPQGAQIIQHRFTVKAWQLDWNIDPAKAQAVAAWPESFEPYLRNEAQAVVIDERIKSTALQLIPTKSNAAGDIAKIIGWTNENMKYDHVNASLAASSQHAIEQKMGHCSDNHGLCSALGRALGYPARVTYGINAFPKNGPSHCKLEAYVPGYGWVSFDVSETQKLIADIGKDTTLDEARKQALTYAANARLARGFRDNTWILHTRGTDYDLVPKASKRAAVIRTIYAEVDGKQLKDPDPNSSGQSEFAWMTSHEYNADKKVTYPFKDWSLLEGKAGK